MTREDSERTDTIVDESDWQVRYTDNQMLGELKVERTDIIEDGGDWQVRYTYTTIKLEEERTYIIEDKGDW